MKKILSILLVFLMCCGILSSAYAAELETISSKALKELLQKNSGKVIMLNFFATWCPPCRAEIPELIAASKMYKGKKVAFIGLSVDDPKTKDTVKKFVSQLNIPYPVYMAGQDLVSQYAIGSIPHNVFYDKAGTLIISQPGECDREDIRLVVEELLHDN